MPRIVESSSLPLPPQAFDERRLEQLGYKQELKRNWSLMHNFGISFSIIVSLHDPLRRSR